MNGTVDRILLESVHQLRGYILTPKNLLLSWTGRVERFTGGSTPLNLPGNSNPAFEAFHVNACTVEKLGLLGEFEQVRYYGMKSAGTTQWLKCASVFVAGI